MMFDKFLAIVARLGLATLTTAAELQLPLPVSEVQRSEPVDFGNDILPMLQRNCLACHHQKEAEGGLILETLASVLAGGDSGPGVVAHDATASLVFTRASGTEEPLMPPEDNTVGAAALTAEELGLLKLWIEQGATGRDASEMQPIQWQPIPESIRSVYALDIAPDNSLAAVGRANRVVIVDLTNNTEVGQLVDPSLTVGPVADVDLIQSIAFSPDGNRIATGGFRTVRLWKKTPAQIADNLAPLAVAAGLVAINDDQTSAAIVNAIGDVEVWDLANQKRLSTLAGHPDAITGLAYATQANRIVVGQQFGLLTVWDALTGNKICELDTQSAIVDLAAAGDGTLIAALNASRKVELLRVVAATETEAAKIERVHEGLGGIGDALAVELMSQPSPLAVVVSESAGVVCIEPNANQNLRTINHEAVVNAIAVSADHTKLVTGGRDGKTRVWNLDDGKPIATASGSPASRLILAAAQRDAARQTAEVARLTAKTAELETLLKQENEALVKVTEARDKATTAVTEATGKHVAATTLVTTTKTTLDAANVEAAKAAEMIKTSTEQLAAFKVAAETLATELQAALVPLDAAKAEVAKLEQVNAEDKTPLNNAKANVERLQTAFSEKQTAKTAADEQVTKTQMELDAANKLAADTKVVVDKTTKDLETHTKAAAVTEEAKKKSETDLMNREQALAAATAAQVAATAAIPAHQTVIATQTRHSEVLTGIEKQVQQQFATAAAIVAVAISLDGQRIASVGADAIARLYATADGLPIREFAANDASATTEMLWVADTLCLSAPRHSSELFSTALTWQLERTIGAVDSLLLSDRVTALDFGRDGLSLAVGSGAPSRAGEVKIFAVPNGELLRDFGDVHSDTVLGLDFSPDGRTLASGAADKTIRLLNVVTGQTNRTLEGHTHHVLGVSWQDSGRTLASASADLSIKVWDVESGQVNRTITGFRKEITSIEFVGTTNQVIAALAHGEVRLADTSNGGAVRNFGAGGDFLFTARVSDNGKKVIAGGQSGVIRIWNFENASLIAELK